MQRIYPTGSFYDGIRVADPGEFDLDILLDLGCCPPLDIHGTDKGGYVMAECIGDPAEVIPDADVRRVILDEAGFLDAACIRKWMESVVTRASESVLTFFEVHVTKNGPAMTLKICDGQRSVDVDLVPVFDFRLGCLQQKHPETIRELGNIWKVDIQLRCFRDIIDLIYYLMYSASKDQELDPRRWFLSRRL